MKFVRCSGVFECKRMPFGLNSAPATFQRACDMFLSGVKWQRCLINMEDVIVYSEAEKEHLHHVDRGIRQLPAALASLKLPKCRSCTMQYHARVLL